MKGGGGSRSSPAPVRAPRRAHLVVLQTGDEDLGEQDHPGAADSGAAVDQHGQVGVLGVTDAVGVSPH